MIRKKMFNFNENPTNEDIKIQMINAYFVIQEKLSDEEISVMQEKYNKYKQNKVLKNQEYLDWYLWFLQNIKVSIN